MHLNNDGDASSYLPQRGRCDKHYHYSVDVGSYGGKHQWARRARRKQASGVAQKLQNNWGTAPSEKGGAAVHSVNITSLYSEGTLAHGQFHKREMIDMIA